jgi:putative SOS response-associated peptidase YedK
MCGRFIQTTDADVLAAIYQIQLSFSLRVRYNAAPTQELAVIRRVDGDAPREVAHLRWGLVPSWARPGKLPTLINARSETAAEKPSFKRALARRRCLVLSDGWYEWLRDGKSRRPFLFRRKDRAPFVYAGIWERWTRGDAPLMSFSILTTQANPAMEKVHHRMPVVVHPSDHDLWLDPDVMDLDRLQSMLAASPASDWDTIEVVPLVNNVNNQGPELLEPVGDRQ